jgi:hypothetical protein
MDSRRAVELSGAVVVSMAGPPRFMPRSMSWRWSAVDGGGDFWIVCSGAYRRFAGLVGTPGSLLGGLVRPLVYR